MGVFSDIKPINHAARNPFSLGSGLSINTKAGLILPVKFFPTLPNSEYKLDLSGLLRTQPFNNAAFAGFSVNFDVLWSPYNDHYSSFNQFIAQRLNKQHVTQPDIQHIPTFSLGRFKSLVICGALYDYFAAQISEESFYRYSNARSITIPRYLAYSEHLPEESMFLSTIRTLDMLEYGNILPLLKAYANAFEQYFENDVTYAVTTDKDLPTVFKFAAYVKGLVTSDTMASMGGMSFTSTTTTTTLIGSIYNILINNSVWSSATVSQYFPNGPSYFAVTDSRTLWPVFLYNKAFWQFYRSEQYDIDYGYFTYGAGSYTKTTMPYVNMFNADDISNAFDIGSGSAVGSHFMRLICMFAIKPHLYKKDLFTAILPSTQYGSVSTMPIDPEWFNLMYKDVDLSSNKIGRTNNNSLIYLAPITSSGGGQTNTVSNKFNSAKFSTDPALTVSVLEMRKADALQRFRERMLRAGNKTKDIFKAHGWEEPLSEKAFDVQFFGNYDARLDINVVAATGETKKSNGDEVNLGQLAGNGVCAIHGNSIHFKSHDFGTLLVVCYIVKDALYDAYGVHKSHALIEAFDFPYPELQNISLSPITEDQLNSFKASPNTSVLGYEPQNMTFKTQSDLIHGEFFGSNPFYLDPHLSLASGIFADMVATRNDILECKALSFLYCQPSCTAYLFNSLFNGLQSSDQFFGFVQVDCSAVQPLDVIGLPI